MDEVTLDNNRKKRSIDDTENQLTPEVMSILSGDGFNNLKSNLRDTAQTIWVRDYLN